MHGKFGSMLHYDHAHSSFFGQIPDSTGVPGLVLFNNFLFFGVYSIYWIYHYLQTVKWFEPNLTIMGFMAIFCTIMGIGGSGVCSFELICSWTTDMCILSRATSHGAPWLRWPEDGRGGNGGTHKRRFKLLRTIHHSSVRQATATGKGPTRGRDNIHRTCTTFLYVLP